MSTHVITDAVTVELKRDLCTTKRHRVQTRRNRGQCDRMTHMVVLPLSVCSSKRASAYNNASTARHAWPAHALNELYMDGVAAKVTLVHPTYHLDEAHVRESSSHAQ